MPSRNWQGGSSYAWRRVRRLVLERDGYTCRVQALGICTQTATQVHHTLGRGVTGDDPNYLVACCRACNLHIGDPTKNVNPPPLTWGKW